MSVDMFKTVVTGFLEVNCYIVPCVEDGCVYIIDPGASAKKIAETARTFSLENFKIILTHAHIDHIGGISELCSILPSVDVFLHKDDMLLYKSPANELPPLLPAVSDPVQPVHDFSSSKITLIHTPGHTKGSVCYHFEKEKLLFSGDTLFLESVGRTDLPGGDQAALVSSIRNKLFTLPPDTRVFPGHGPETTIGHETKSNPFI